MTKRTRRLTLRRRSRSLCSAAGQWRRSAGVGEIRVGNRTIGTSSESRGLFPRGGITKRDIIDYYRQIAPAMVPHVKGRRLTMQRYPRGIDGEAFFQKEISDYFPA